MPDTAARLLRLLSLLQARRDWSGPALAQRLGVTVRSVRRDVDRLRQLGYSVEATPGPAGGYRLGVGQSLPPLLLDDDEAAAVAIGLAVAAGGAVAGMEEAALGALAKLDRLLPPRLRARVQSVRSSVERFGSVEDTVSPELLVLLAQAAAESERVLLSYRDREQRETERRVEPYRLVSTGRRWYLVAHDLERSEWRTFRVDRVLNARLTGHRFRLENPPDARELVSRGMSVAPYRYTARVHIQASVNDVRRRVPETVGIVKREGGRTVLTTGSDRLELLAGHLVSLGFGFEVLEPPELASHIESLARVLLEAHGLRAQRR